jgi:pilus assembly protein CpaE
MTDADHQIIAPVPRITIQAFCESSQIADIIQSTATDRRMQKAHLKIQMGGAPAAVEAYRHAPTPNVIVLEFQNDKNTLLAHLDSLAESCDAGTKVIVIGHVNDVLLYRELIRRGISEYMIAPFQLIDFIRAVSELFNAPGADPVGRTIAVYGAKGGVGASTIAHNIAWSLARNIEVSTVIVDLDIAFGTAGLDFNQDPPQGIADVIFAPDRVDSGLIDRLMSKCSDNLSLLAAPALLDKTCDLPESALDAIIDVLRSSVQCIVLDVPHVWDAWTRRTLVSADEIVIVSTPELASLRNTKNIIDLLKQYRPNDSKVKVILNQVGIPKRPEISTAEFAKAVGIELQACIPFDAQLFGSAANNGQMISEIQSHGKVSETFINIASSIMGRGEVHRQKNKLLHPFVAKLARIKSS